MLVRITRLLAIGVCALGFALSAQAGPAMFNASFLIHAWGNDISTGTTYPYNSAVYSGAPMGQDCQHASPSTPNGVINTRYCTNYLVSGGYPATGMGTLATGTTTVLAVGAPIALAQSAFNLSVTGFLRTYYPYLQSHTYATIHNEAATFFADGGPAAGLGELYKKGNGQTIGSWAIREGANGLGGVMGILGKYGAIGRYVVAGKVGTYEGTSSWGIIPQMGREQSVTIIGYTAMGKALFQNPIENVGVFVNNYNSNISSLQVRGTGSPWTTGTVTVYAQAGIFQTILARSGYDTVTGTGTTKVRNIQLVTPTLTHWIGPGYQTHTGQVGVLTLTITPEPEAFLMLAAGGGLLALLYRASRRH